MRQTLHRLFGEGFRIFFLAAGVFGLLAALYWEIWLGMEAFGGTGLSYSFAPPPHLWHAHEMIFGYAGAALGGFFLTAVPNWTGAKAARHAFIALVAGFWLAGRVAIWMSGSLPPLIVAAVDLAFLPVLTAKILTQLLRRPKPQNMMFLGLLTLIWLSNTAVHAEWSGLGGPGAETGLRAGLLGICAMIAVLGGRVTPAFTRNAMIRAGRETDLPASRKPVEILGIASAIALPVSVLVTAPEPLIASLALGTGAAQLIRLAGWRTGWTLGQPILWSLHLAFGMLGAGYLLLGAALMGIGSEVAALHVLGIGTVGGMTVAVMSRAILGHSGRALIAPRPVALAFGLIAGAALLRWVGSSAQIDLYLAAMLTAGALWIAAMALFILSLLPAILGPRVSE